MRDILFRGKRSNGEWTYGNLQTAASCAFISEFMGYCNTVAPETVGQYTGLTDMNGKKIFEGDIVRITTKDYWPYCEVGVVEFKDCCFSVSYFNKLGFLRIHRIGQIDEEKAMGAHIEIRYTYEIIGNIHDNPELLPAKEE